MWRCGLHRLYLKNLTDCPDRYADIISCVLIDGLDLSSKSKSLQRVVVLLACAGKCGFGRDTSIAVGGTREAPTVYVSFLDYNGDGKAKRASLAILKPAPAGALSLQSPLLRMAAAPAPPPDGGKDDICTDKLYVE